MKVHELLSNKSAWIKLSYARDYNNNIVSCLSDEAVCFCLAGAIMKCYNDNYIEIVKKVEDYIKIKIEFYNDTHTYEEVLALDKKLDI